MSRSTKSKILSLCAGALGLVFDSAAQDLRQEVGAEPHLEIHALEGISPTLVSCEISEKGRLRCLVDQDVDEVLCEESFQKQVKKVSLKKNYFLCDVSIDPAQLSQSLDIEIKEKVRGFQSKWRIRVSSLGQMKNAYTYELKSKRKVSRPWVNQLQLTTGAQVYLSESDIYSGTQIGMGSGPLARTELSLLFPVSSTHKKMGYQLGYKRNLMNTTTPTDWGLWLGLKRDWRSRSMGPLDPIVGGWILDITFQKGLMLSTKAIDFWVGLSPAWYAVDKFRQAYSAEFGSQVPVWRDLSLKMLLGWDSEIWTHQSYQNNQSQVRGAVLLSYSLLK